MLSLNAITEQISDATIKSVDDFIDDFFLVRKTIFLIINQTTLLSLFDIIFQS